MSIKQAKSKRHIRLRNGCLSQLKKSRRRYLLSRPMTSASSKSSHALEARSLKAWKASYMRKVETGVSIALPKRNTRIVVGQLKSTQFGRECKSRRVHQLSLKAAMMELAYILLSKRRFCGFDSHWRYHSICACSSVEQSLWFLPTWSGV